VAGPSDGSRFDRLSSADLTMMLTDRGQVPMNTGAVLVFDRDGPSLAELRALLTDRVATVPRLRQRVHRPPPGGGPPLWVDDPGFALEDHLDGHELPPSATLSRLLDLAAVLVCQRLTADRPPWRASAVTDPGTGLVTSLVLVAHHVMADGLGGLAVLSALADPGRPARSEEFPRPRPVFGDLALDAAACRVRSLTHLPARLRQGVAGLRELGAGRGRPLLAGTTSLTRRTSGRRRFSMVDVSLAEVVDTAHAVGGTVNDVVLAAIGGALMRLLERRGEEPPAVVVSVPVSGRAAADPGHLGNQTGVRPIRVPLVPDDRARLEAVVDITRAAAGGSRASSSGPLGLAFRFLARLGLFAWFVDRQRLVDTFETNLRGPAEPLQLGGHRVTAIIPMAVNPGNIGVSFDVMSYAARLRITIVADPVVVPELDLLGRLLTETMTRLIREGRTDDSGTTSGPVPSADGTPSMAR
jgi:diacylglycerol O-acyltransferase